MSKPSHGIGPEDKPPLPLTMEVEGGQKTDQRWPLRTIEQPELASYLTTYRILTTFLINAKSFLIPQFGSLYDSFSINQGK